MRKTSVLIIGAGPTGLMVACQLAIHKIPFILVEKETGPTDESRAIGIQARTLEIFHQMGIEGTFLANGYQAGGLSFLINGRIKQHISLKGLGVGMSAFPFLLIHEQPKTEKALTSFLEKHHRKIEYDTEVLTFTQDEANVTAKVKLPDGKDETIEADWIIGADGAHSIVRHTLGIPLAGKTYKQSLFVLDCEIESSLPQEDLSVALSDTSFAAFFPMKSNRWRIVGEIPKELQGKDTITFEEVQKYFPKEIHIPLTLSNPHWISLYHSHHRCVATFRDHRAFLLGDAAHIHSPIGAQGMNTGLQDAYNLAWKLAFVIQGKAHKKILDTYNTERIAFARKLVNTTDKAFNVVVTSNPLVVFFRERLMPHVLHLLVTHKKSGAFIFRTISQIGISYHNSQLSQNASFGKFPKHAPLPGDRLPYVVYNEGDTEKNIQDFIAPLKMQLLLFTGKDENGDEVRKIASQYEKTIDITEILLIEETKNIYQQFGITTTGFYLIRPDMYIACRGNMTDTSHLRSYLSRFFSLT